MAPPLWLSNEPTPEKAAREDRNLLVNSLAPWHSWPTRILGTEPGPNSSWGNSMPQASAPLPFQASNSPPAPMLCSVVVPSKPAAGLYFRGGCPSAMGEVTPVCNGHILSPKPGRVGAGENVRSRGQRQSQLPQWTLGPEAATPRSHHYAALVPAEAWAAEDPGPLETPLLALY